jgi:hypothetical protein
MISNLIYSFIFIIFVALIIALIEDKAKKNFGTKIIEIDGNHFLVPDFSSKGSDPKEIRSTGSKITCEVLSDLTGQRVRLNNYVDGSKSVITGDPVHVDCHEMIISLESFSLSMAKIILIMIYMNFMID